MDAATLTRAIEPFFSTKGIGKGTGLGLSMVHGLALQLGGAIDIQSRLGLGTNVMLWLPQSVAAQDIVEVVQEPGEIPASSGVALLVDDEEIVLTMATLLLESKGFRVLGAGNGMEALAVLRSHPDIAVTILDVTMPVMTGEQALPLIKELAPGMPVILSSGFSEAEISRRFGGVGAAGFLQKPYSLQILVKKIQEALRHEALQQEPVGLAIDR